MNEFRNLSYEKRIAKIREIAKEIYTTIKSKYQGGFYTTIKGGQCTVNPLPGAPVQNNDSININYDNNNIFDDIYFYLGDKKEIKGIFRFNKKLIDLSIQNKESLFYLEGTIEEYNYLLSVLADVRNLELEVEKTNTNRNNYLRTNQQIFGEVQVNLERLRQTAGLRLNRNYIPIFEHRDLSPKIIPASMTGYNPDEGISLVEYFLSNTIGLGTVKEQIERFVAKLEFDKKTNEFLKNEIPNLHMIFTGPAGSGKTMMATAMANIFHELGFLDKINFQTLKGQFTLLMLWSYLVEE